MRLKYFSKSVDFKSTLSYNRSIGVQGVTKFVIDGQELSDISEHLNKEVIAFGVRGNTLIIKTGD